MSHFLPAHPSTLEDLKEILGPAGWKEEAEASRYFEDPRGRFTGRGRMILLPKTTGEVSDIVRICNAEGIGLIPYGGGTGVVAGQLSIDSDDAVIISLERMNRVREISPQDNTMVAEAGCILSNIHAAALEQGMVFPLDMASKGSCCIGGNLATNAGGIQVLRHGNARDLCVGIEAVLPDGSLLSELNPLRKNNTGYDLRHLLIGSEGTLGIITAATLLLKPVEPESVTVFCAIERSGQAVALLRRLRGDLGDSLSCMELMSHFGLELVTRHFPDLKRPFDQPHSWYLLLEVSGQIGIRDRLLETLTRAMDPSAWEPGKIEQAILLDVIVAETQGQSSALWDLRENTPEANRLTGAICNSDTSVPISRIEDFIAETTQAIHQLHEGLRINSYGHIGDGNIHHNVFPPEGSPKAEFVKNHPGIIDAVRMAINDVTHNHGGSISAEHGIGRLKTVDLEHYASAAKLGMMKAIKQAIDPKNIMNPGVIFR